MEYLASHGYVGDLDRRWQADLRKVILNEFGSNSYRALFYFFERAYWRRLWIFQEITLGSQWMILLCGERVLSWKIVRDAALFMAQCAFDIFSKGVADTLRDAGTPIVDPLSIKGVFHVASIAALDSIHVVEQKPLVKREKSKATVTNDKKRLSSQNDGSASMTSSKESLEMLPTAETRALQQLEEKRRAHMPSLLELLAIGQNAECLEPKDKVYGL